MSRKIQYPFQALQPGQTAHVRTNATPQQMASSAWRAGVRETERTGVPTKYSVRKVSADTYALTRIDPAQPIPGAEIIDAPTVLSPEQMQAQQDEAYRAQFRARLRQKAIREQVELEMEVELRSIKEATRAAKAELQRLKAEAAAQREQEILARERRIVESLGPNATMDEIDAAIAKAELEDL